MTVADYRGAMFSPFMELDDSSQGEIAPIGGPSDTPLTLRLIDAPISAAAVCLYVGPSASQMFLVYPGVHYRLDLTTLTIYWLRTAPFALNGTQTVGVSYFAKGLTL
jgi:hypothetical protein